MKEETVAVPVALLKEAIKRLHPDYDKWRNQDPAVLAVPKPLTMPGRYGLHSTTSVVVELEALLPKPRSARAMIQACTSGHAWTVRDKGITADGILAQLDAERENLRKCLMSICDCGECATIRAWLKETE